MKIFAHLISLWIIFISWRTERPKQTSCAIFQTSASGAQTSDFLFLSIIFYFVKMVLRDHLPQQIPSQCIRCCFSNRQKPPDIRLHLD